MKAVFRVLSLVAFACLLPGARAADPSGTWKGAFDFQGSEVPLTINLKIDGAKVTGTVEGLPTTPADIHDGTLTGDKGKVTGDQISFDFGTEEGSWSTTLTVKKSASPSAAATETAAAPDVTGDWKGTFDLNGTPTELTFHLKNSGNTVTGTLERAGAAPVELHEGKIEGDTVSFWITTDYEGETYTIVYKGKIEAGAINFDFGTSDQSWSAQMTAKKS